jgi:hypothetical protein
MGNVALKKVGLLGLGVNDEHLPSKCKSLSCAAPKNKRLLCFGVKFF